MEMADFRSPTFSVKNALSKARYFKFEYIEFYGSQSIFLRNVMRECVCCNTHSIIFMTNTVVSI